MQELLKSKEVIVSLIAAFAAVIAAIVAATATIIGPFLATVIFHDHSPTF
ncbi:MAG: hypothetical protein HYV06_01725 [Deltaproteobacteria bacterium]|nr:hypothetical protein [Deltaproteobacteria bacterium]